MPLVYSPHGGYKVTDLNSTTIIILATYNGAEFLAEQLDSLLGQTLSDTSVLIRDDGSTDQSVEIIREYIHRDQRITLLQDELGATGSALGNFSILANTAYARGAEYIFFCDQDDVWELNKIEIMLAKLKQLEGDDKKPSLVHHDLVVVNKSLEPIADSFIKLMRLYPSDERNPQRQVSRNEVTGCAMACNRALLEIALPISDKAVMHDWWLALCAVYFGRIAFIPAKLVYYRQHKSNAIGAKSFWHGLNPLTNWIAGWQRGNEEAINAVKQAGAFKDTMTNSLDKNTVEYLTVALFSELQAATRSQRLRMLRICNLWRSHWILNVVLVLRMLLLPRDPG